MFRVQFHSSLVFIQRTFGNCDIVSVSKAESAKYLGFATRSCLRWSSETFGCVAGISCLSFQFSRMLQFSTKQAVINSFAYHCVPPILPYYSPVILSGLLKKDFRLLHRSPSITSWVPSIPVECFIYQVFYLHNKTYEKFSTKFLAHPTRSLHNGLSSYHPMHPSVQGTD